MLFSVILLVVLIFINGIFSACEISFLSIDKAQLHQEIKKGNKKAKIIDKIMHTEDTFLATTQVAITLAGFLASAFGADYFAKYFMNIIEIDFISPGVLNVILVILITLVLSYFTLVFGELVPKRIALSYPEKVSYTFVYLIVYVKKLFLPLIKLLTSSTDFVCKILRIKHHRINISEKDIKKMIILGGSTGVIEAHEKDYILNVFNFNDVDVYEVMTPIENVVMIDIEDHLKTNLLKIKESKYSRFPVYKKDMNNVIGILNVKDIILESKDNKNVSLSKIVRPIRKILYTEKIDDVFRTMQENNESMCVIYKEDKVVGVVTIEDAVEEIVGNIYDEYDKV